MTHTNDIGCAIAEVLNDFALDVLTWDWDAEDSIPLHPVQLAPVDASEGFSNLIITTSDGCKFRVSITRIG
jgi:hypothetical protein